MFAGCRPVQRRSSPKALNKIHIVPAKTDSEIDILPPESNVLRSFRSYEPCGILAGRMLCYRSLQTELHFHRE